MSGDTELTEDAVQAALEALESGWLTMGPRVAALETAFARQLGVAHAVAVSSGTYALHLSAIAIGVAPGASLVVSALADPAAANAARYAGGTPRRADVTDAVAPTLTRAAVRAAAAQDTIGVIASHLGGLPVDAIGLRDECDARGWWLIEDATAALGTVLRGDRAAGTVGHVGCYSFSAGRLVSVGEGGMVVTDDDELASRIRLLRSHAMTSVTWDRHRGHAESYDVVDVGFNARLDEPRAALAARQLERLDSLVEGRRERFRALFGEDAPLGAAPQHVPFVAADREGRDELVASLNDRGVRVTTWRDGFIGVPSPARAPLADAARERTALVDLGGTDA